MKPTDKFDSGKNNAKSADDSIPIEVSQPIMAPKFSASSSAVLGRKDSTTNSTASIKTDADSSTRVIQQSSDEQAKGEECGTENATESTSQIKRDMTVQFAKNEPDEHILPKNSDNVINQTRVSKRVFSSVINVEPGAPPPTNLEPDVRLHIRQPFKILIDIWGVLTSYSFRNDLYAYVDEHIKSFLVAHFDVEETKAYINDLAKRTVEDLATGIWPDMPPVPEEKSEPDEIVSHTEKKAIAEAVVRNLTFRKEATDKSLMKGLDLIHSQIWNEGYRTKTLRPLVFPDVMRNLRKWHAEPLFIKMYSFATGPPEIQKLFLSASTEGDVTEYLTYFFDTRHSYKYDSNRYRQVVSGLSEREAKNLFYLTDSPKKGCEARKAGLTVFIVRREGNKQYKPHDLDKFPVIDSLDQFDFFEFQ